MGSEQVAQVLRKVGQHVKLVIARLVTDDSSVDAASKEEVHCMPYALFLKSMNQVVINTHFIIVT